jgi:hypothetical protein
MTWTHSIISELREQLDQAPRGNKRALADQLASNLGVSTATLYRRIDMTNGEKKCHREPEVDQKHIEIVAKIKTEPFTYGVNGRLLATEDAIAIAEDSGAVPEGTLHVATVDRRLREAGYKQPRMYTRHEEEYVNQVHQMDFSRSEYFEVIERDGEFMLRVDGRRGVWEYKNKEKASRLRLWVVGYMDAKSRAYLARYYPATGENLMMATQFLAFAWNREDSLHPLQHLPDVLKLDQGAIGKSAVFRDSLKKNLDIRVELAAPKNDRLADNQSMGKIERRFRSLWQKFELRLAYTLKKKGIAEISLADMNVLVHNYCCQLLTNQHPAIKQTVREVYETGLRIRDQKPKTLQTDIFSLLFAEATRKVNVYAEISIDSELYRVPRQFIGQKVKFYTNPEGELMGSSMDGKVVFELIAVDAENATGERRHEPTYMEEAGRTPADIEASGLRIVPRPDSPAIMPHTLPAIEEQVEKETPFKREKKVAKHFTEWESAKMYICEVFDCRWSDIEPKAQEVFVRLFEKDLLDKATINDLKNVS